MAEVRKGFVFMEYEERRGPGIMSSCLIALRISRQRLFLHIVHNLPQDTLW